MEDTARSAGGAKWRHWQIILGQRTVLGLDRHWTEWAVEV